MHNGVCDSRQLILLIFLYLESLILLCDLSFHSSKYDRACVSPETLEKKINFILLMYIEMIKKKLKLFSFLVMRNYDFTFSAFSVKQHNVRLSLRTEASHSYLTHFGILCLPM